MQAATLETGPNDTGLCRVVASLLRRPFAALRRYTGPRRRRLVRRICGAPEIRTARDRSERIRYGNFPSVALQKLPVRSRPQIGHSVPPGRCPTGEFEMDGSCNNQVVGSDPFKAFGVRNQISNEPPSISPQ